jgi:hypothetical protein
MASDPNAVFLFALDLKQAGMPSLPHPRMSVEMANLILCKSSSHCVSDGCPVYFIPANMLPHCVSPGAHGWTILKSKL